ncbi:MAG: PKD domain-containing protein, partial [Vicinamibacteria bacterium]
MWNRVKWALVIALIPVALGQAGCNLEDATRPPLAGPSELGQALRMTANPDQLTANGSSSSVIEVTLFDEFGQPDPGVTINFDLLSEQGFFADVGVLAPLGGPRPVPGGREPKAESAVTNSEGRARVRYWAPFRTDQENDATVTITGRPAGTDFRAAVFRQVDIFLRAANRPMFPGGSACAFIVEPLETTYTVGQLLFFTATQIVGDTTLGCAGNTIARYEWDFGDGTVDPAARGSEHAYSRPGVFTVTLFTTESGTGCQVFCT